MNSRAACFFLVIGFLFSSNALSQDRSFLDSLWQVYNDPQQPDSQRVTAIHTLTVKLAFANPDSGIVVGQRYLQFVIGRKLYKNKAGAYNSIGTCYLNIGNLDSALSNFQKGLIIRQQFHDKKGEAAALNNIGIVYYQRGDYSRCIEYYQKSLTIKDSLGDMAGVAASYSNIGMINENQGNSHEALSYYRKSLHIRDSLQDHRAIADSYQKLAGYFLKLKSFDSSEYFVRLSLHHAQIAGDNRSLANGTTNLAHVFQQTGQIDSAEHYYRIALVIHRSMHNQEGIATAQKDLGFLYVEQKDFLAGKLYCDSAFNQSLSTGYPKTQQSSCECLAQAYEALNQPAKALWYYKMAATLSDSLNGIEKSKEIQRKTLQYEFEKDKLEDSLRLQKEVELKDVQNQQILQEQTLYTRIGIAGFVLMVVIAFILLRGYRQKQQSNKELERKNVLIEEKQKEIVDSITYAKRLQEAILPSMETMREFLKNGFVLYKPKDIVAGDFYWLEHVNGVTFVAAADCTGHGVPGAMVSVVCSTALNRSVLEFGITEPGKILDRTRNLVLETFSKSSAEVNDGMDISLIALTTNEIHWAGANIPLWVVENGVLTVHKADKQPIGKTYHPQPFHTTVITRTKGMRLYLLTDGYADQFGGAHGKKFKYKQLEKILLESSMADMDSQGKLLDITFGKWKGNLEQVDDVCVIGIELN